MSDRAAFIAAIAANPDDDLPRRIFADWLDENGDPARAEFIRLQCAAARGKAAAHARAAVLEAAHRTEWLGPLVRIAYGCVFRRGFVEHATLPAAVFLADGLALRRQTPLRGVTLLGAGRILAELLNAPVLRDLAALHLTGARLGDDGVRLLAASSVLAGLTTLRLGDNAIGDRGVMALARSPYLSGLSGLVLRDNAIGDGGAWELSHSPFFARLAILDLAGNEIGSAGVEALRSGKKLAALVDLDVNDQRPPAGRRRRGRRPAAGLVAAG
jgi:uncharacterized protein (TIGR02996 family)